MKVYVMTEAEPFQPEIFVDVVSTFKEAEKAFRSKYPHMKNFSPYTEYWTSSDPSGKILFIREKEIDMKGGNKK